MHWKQDVTYEWKTTVVAYGDLGLVAVDKDPRVSCGATTAVAGHHTVVCPAYRLLVDEFYGGVGLRLKDSSPVSDRVVWSMA